MFEFEDDIKSMNGVKGANIGVWFMLMVDLIFMAATVNHITEKEWQK